MATVRARRTWRTMGLGLLAATLTTPPCRENVKWMVLQAPETASADQVGEFADIVGPNNRPVQPLNGWEVLRDES